MSSTGILIALLAGYFAFLILGSKVFRINRRLWTSCTNLILSIILLVYTLYTGMLQNSPFLLVAFCILTIGSIIRIVTYKKEADRR